MKVLISTACFCLFALGLAQPIQAQDQIANYASATGDAGSTQQDGLNGQVNTVRVETVNLLIKEGKAVEGPRVVREITSYDQQGKKINSVAYPVADSTVVGNNQQYLYDASGNIIEMVVRGDDGHILNKEKYEYQFDEFGNWEKMTASIAVYENGNVFYEPFEITYRTITYHSARPAPRIITASAVMPSSNTSKTATASGPPQITEPPSGAPLSDAATGIATTDEKKTGNAAEAIVVKPEKSEPSITAPAQPVDSSEASANPANDSKLTATSFYTKGLTFLASGRYADAAEALREATRRDPNDAAAYAKLGLAYAALQNYEEAVVVFKMAIRIKPEMVDAEAHYQLGNAYLSLGKNSQALETYKQAMYIKRAEKADPESGNATKAPSFPDLHYSTGLAYYNLGRFSNAIEELKRAIALNPDMAQAYYGLGLSQIASGDRKSAEKQEKILESLNPVYAAKLAKLLSSSPNNPQGFGFVFQTNHK
jgi:tetratricopeptide (TPR) repeat protein